MSKLELEITNYFIGSACPHVEEHVGAADCIHHVQLDRTDGIIEVNYTADQTTLGQIIEALKHYGFIFKNVVRYTKQAGATERSDFDARDDAGCSHGSCLDDQFSHRESLIFKELQSESCR